MRCENIDNINIEKIVLNYYRFNKNHMLIACSHKEAAIMIMRGNKTRNLHDRINNTRIEEF